MDASTIIGTIRQKFELLGPVMTERMRRQWAASEALALPRGGMTLVAQATGMSRTTIWAGVRELRNPSDSPPAPRGDPMSPLRWTCKSTRKLAEGLQHQGHDVSHQTVALLLQAAGYSLQSNRKTREGGSHPDRDAQFEHINARVVALQRRGQPVISVDTKKKELIGDFKNNGQEWQPEGRPEEVRAKDFPDQRLGKAIPYGV